MINAITEITKTIRNRYDIDVFTVSLITPLLEELNARNGLRGSLLDLGCGQAEKSDMFRRVGYTVTGIDVTHEYLETARKNYPEIIFVEHNIHLLPFEDNSFDVVYSSSVLQYLDYDVVIKEVYRVLKPGGVFVSFENLVGNPFARFARLLYKVFGFYYTKLFLPRRHLSLDDIRLFEREFDTVSYSVHYFLLAGLEILLTGLTFAKLLPHYHFSKYGRTVMDIMQLIDEPMLKIRFLQKYAWRWLLFAGKRE